MGRNGAEWVSRTVKHSRHKRILKRVSGIGRGEGGGGERRRKRREKHRNRNRSFLSFLFFFPSPQINEIIGTDSTKGGVVREVEKEREIGEKYKR